MTRSPSAPPWLDAASRGRIAVLYLVLAGIALSSSPQGFARQTATEAETVWTCPMHRELSESEPGACSTCGMDLVETRVRRVWACPLHEAVTAAAPGTCRICGRELFPVSVEVHWICPMHPEERTLEPGVCSLCGMDLTEHAESRPHQDHNPRHGGIFFMAPDNWHHLEGVYPEHGAFRVYLYDNYSRSLDARAFTGRAVLGEERDPATGELKEIEAYPLLPSPAGNYLEADVGEAPLPREITAKIRFGPGGAEERFDFIFPELSTTSTVAAEPAAAALAARLEAPVPELPEDIVTEIAIRDLRVRQLVRKGAYTEIYIPALEAKDLCLALAVHRAKLSPPEARRLERAMKELVRSAWLLDAYGDLGNRENVAAAYAVFGEAVREIQSTYGNP